MRIAFAVLCLVGILASKESRENILLGESLSYRLIYNGISGADAAMNIGTVADNTLTLHWAVQTGPVFSFLFPVNNEYFTFLDHNENMLVAMQKNIDQRNIKHNMTIAYDFCKNQAVTDDGASWQVPAGTTNLMAMLYDLRSRDLQAGDSLHYIIDVEQQIWKLNGYVNCDSLVEHEHITGPTRQIHFAFTPVDSIRARPWKTDLFTNNVAGMDAQLNIIIGPQPQNIPLFIQFLNGKKRVEMYLKE